MRAGPLGQAAFRRLFIARTTSVLGNAIAPLALAFAVLDLTGSASDLGLVVACRSVAMVAVLLFGGMLADRLPRTLVLVGTSLAAGGTQALVAALVFSGAATIPLLAALSVVNGAVAALALPASSALVPQTVPAELLRPANALLRLGMNGGSVIGASAGAALVAAVGPGVGLAIDAAAFLAAAAVFAGIRLPRDAGASRAVPAPSGLRDLREGWTEFVHRRWVWVVVAQFAVVNAAFVGAIAVLGPLVADLSIGRAAWGVAIAAQTVGFVLGGLLALRWHPRRALGVGVGLVAVTAVPMFVLAGAPALAALVPAFLVSGIALEQLGVAWDQSLQQNIPADRLARVYSYDALGSFLGIPVGEVLVGPLAGALGTTPVLIGCGVAVVIASAGALGVRSVRTLAATPS